MKLGILPIVRRNYLMLKIKYSGKFLKSFKRIKLTKNEEEDLKYVITSLQKQKQLENRFKRHNLLGKFKGLTDIHIRQNIVLLVKITEDTLFLYDIGTHAEVLHL